MSINLKFFYWPTPNGRKVSILLEELGITYETIFVNIRKGEQFADDFEMSEFDPNTSNDILKGKDAEEALMKWKEEGRVKRESRQFNILPKTER